MNKCPKIFIALMLCIAFSMPNYAMSSNDSIHEFSGLPFGMSKDKIDGWLQASMSGEYEYLDYYKLDDYERIEIEGRFQYNDRTCEGLIMQLDTAHKLTNLDFRILDASYYGDDNFNMDQLISACDGYFKLVQELTAIYGAPDGSLLRYGDMDNFIGDMPYPEDEEALRTMAKEDVPYMTVLRFGNILLTCHKSGLGAAYDDVTLGTTLFFFAPSKLEFAKELFPLYPNK